MSHTDFSSLLAHFGRPSQPITPVSPQQTSFASLLARLRPQPKPKVFVSYHHGNDEAYADRFGRLFDDTYDVVTDRSLEDRVESDDLDYVYQRIREEFITGTSCTIVLCGTETMNRCFVDWEIKATLDKKHGLLGVILPSLAQSGRWTHALPVRLRKNVESGYAHLIHWTDDAASMLRAINVARDKAERPSSTWLIRTAAPMMARNRPVSLMDLLRIEARARSLAIGTTPRPPATWLAVLQLRKPSP